MLGTIVLSVALLSLPSKEDAPITGAETGSTWDVTGRAVDGASAGSQLVVALAPAGATTSRADPGG